MKLTEGQIGELKSNMSTLDYTKGMNIIKPTKKDMVDECFLFIGAGGTGGKALKRLKQEMIVQIKESEWKKKARFLLVDTDHNDIDKYVNTEKVFEKSETLQLGYKDDNLIKESINPNGTNWHNVSEWVNPNLYTDSGRVTDFGERGAGGMRQVGRAYLAYLDNYRDYSQTITAIIRDLVNEKVYQH